MEIPTHIYMHTYVCTHFDRFQTHASNIGIQIVSFTFAHLDFIKFEILPRLHTTTYTKMHAYSHKYWHFADNNYYYLHSIWFVSGVFHHLFHRSAYVISRCYVFDKLRANSLEIFTLINRHMRIQFSCYLFTYIYFCSMGKKTLFV